jgi:polyisoprenoid-binding protein YceI
MRIATLTLALIIGTVTYAAPIEFDLKDPKGVNSVSFVLDSQLEPIMGVATGIGGKVTFDPDDPNTLSGTITVATDSMKFGSERMGNVAMGEDWMNAEAHPEISFAITSGHAHKHGNAYQFHCSGNFTCKGVTKPVNVTVVVNYLKDKLGSRMKGKEGDLLAIRSSFTVNRSDFGIKEGMGPEVVAEKIELRISIIGSAIKAAE